METAAADKECISAGAVIGVVIGVRKIMETAVIGAAETTVIGVVETKLIGVVQTAAAGEVQAVASTVRTGQGSMQQARKWNSTEAHCGYHRVYDP